MENVLFMPTKPPWKLGKWLSNFRNVSVANFTNGPISSLLRKNVNFTKIWVELAILLRILMVAWGQSNSSNNKKLLKLPPRLPKAQK